MPIGVCGWGVWIGVGVDRDVWIGWVWICACVDR